MLNTQFVFSPTFNRKLQVVSMDMTNLSKHNGAMLLALNGTRALSLIFWCRASSLPLTTTIINFILQDAFAPCVAFLNLFLLLVLLGFALSLCASASSFLRALSFSPSFDCAFLFNAFYVVITCHQPMIWYNQ